MPSKYCYVFMYILIVLMLLSEIEVGYGHSTAFGIMHHQTQNSVAALSVGSYIILSITVNACLLTIYVRRLLDIAVSVYGRQMNINLLNDHQMDVIGTMDTRIHELMLEASRYVVVFGIVLICDLIIGIYGVIAETIGDRYSALGLVLAIAVLSELFFLSSSVYLSFKFSHSCYEKLYCCCHSWINRRWHEIARNRLQINRQRFQLWDK